MLFKILSSFENRKPDNSMWSSMKLSRLVTEDRFIKAVVENILYHENNQKVILF